jgi:hypothetical protein
MPMPVMSRSASFERKIAADKHIKPEITLGLHYFSHSLIPSITSLISK